MLTRSPFKPNVVADERESSSWIACAALVAVVARQLVDVHVDEAVAALGVHAAAEAERVLERLLAMLERGVDRLAQDLRHVARRLLAEVAPHGVDAERKRQARFEQPPLAEVEALLEAFVAVGQLPLVDQQPRVRAARRDLRLDLVERAARGARRRRRAPASGRGTRSSASRGSTISVARSSSSESRSRATTIGP